MALKICLSATFNLVVSDAADTVADDDDWQRCS